MPSHGLIDCLDPDCCGTDHCEKLIRLRGNLQQVVEDARQSCAHSTEISSLILSTRLPSPGSSFYDQLEFLLLRDLTTDKVDPRPKATASYHQVILIDVLHYSNCCFHRIGGFGVMEMITNFLFNHTPPHA
ncbi:hypothetical protein ACTXT7_000780 [Hymenolepis weldensis]